MAYTLLIFYPLMQVRLTRKLPLSRLTLDQNFNELCANLICNLLVYLVTCQINLASDPLQHIASNMTEAKPWAQLVPDLFVPVCAPSPLVSSSPTSSRQQSSGKHRKPEYSAVASRPETKARHLATDTFPAVPAET